MELLYHRLTFDLLGVQPKMSPQATEQLDSLQETLGLELPESLREWYSLEGAVDQLTLSDDLTRFEVFDVATNTKWLLESPPEVSPRWFIGAYSSGVSYAALLEDLPDPTVVCLETDASIIDNFDEWSNRPFSSFVFACVCHNLQESANNIGGTHPACGPSQIALLRKMFVEGPHVLRSDAPTRRRNPLTGEGDLPVRRFQFFFLRPPFLLWLTSVNDPTVSETEVHWDAYGPDSAELERVVYRLTTRGVLA